MTASTSPLPVPGPAGRGSVCVTPVVDAEDADEIGRFETEEDPPLAHPQPQFTGAVLEGLHIAMARRGETYQGRIDPCLDDAIEARQIAYSRVSQPEPAPDFLQGYIVTGFRTSHVQLGRGLGIDDFLLAQLRMKRNRHLDLSVRKGIHERLKAIAIGRHISIIASRGNGPFRPKRRGWTPHAKRSCL